MSERKRGITVSCNHSLYRGRRLPAFFLFSPSCTICSKESAEVQQASDVCTRVSSALPWNRSMPAHANLWALNLTLSRGTRWPRPHKHPLAAAAYMLKRGVAVSYVSYAAYRGEGPRQQGIPRSTFIVGKLKDRASAPPKPRPQRPQPPLAASHVRLQCVSIVAVVVVVVVVVVCVCVCVCVCCAVARRSMLTKCDN